MWKFADLYPPEAFLNPKLYFAYGSNMSRSQMSNRCPGSSYHGIGFLPGYKFIINERGYANIVRSSIGGTTDLGSDTDSDRVWGLLYWIYPDDESRLDACEGVPWAYGKKELLVESFGSEKSSKEKGVLREAVVYVDERRVGQGVIKREYVGRMERAVRDAVECGVPKEYAEDVLTTCHTATGERKESDEDGDEDGVDTPTSSEAGS